MTNDGGSAHYQVGYDVGPGGAGETSMRDAVERSAVKIATNDRYELRSDALEAAIAADHAAGLRPIAIVATVGTTSSTSVDPVA